MGYPPSALLDTASVADGIEGLSSSATDIEIINNLSFAVFAAFTVYNIAIIFDIDLATIVNLCTAAYYASIDWARFICLVLTMQNSCGRLQRVVSFGDSSCKSSINRIKATPRSVKDSHKLLHWLARTLSNPVTHRSQAITVDTTTVPGCGTIAIIRGLSSDVSAPEVRRYLEITLYTQYRPQIRADRSTSHPDPNNTDDAPIDTSGPGLWNGTCVRIVTYVASTPSISGLNTNASDAGAFVINESSSHASGSLASTASTQRRSTPSCA